MEVPPLSSGRYKYRDPPDETPQWDWDLRPDLMFLLLLLPLLSWLLPSPAVAAACSGDQDCQAELHCYRGLCSTPGQIAEQAFDAGKRVVWSVVLWYCGIIWCGGMIDLWCGVVTIFCPDRWSPGKPCSDHVDCPEACQTVLSSPVCGPFLRSSRLPEPQHSDHCRADSDCSPDQYCLATLRGLECRSWEQVMLELFHLGQQLQLTNSSQTSSPSF